jgi:hypothetical protein
VSKRAGHPVHGSGKWLAGIFSVQQLTPFTEREHLEGVKMSIKHDIKEGWDLTVGNETINLFGKIVLFPFLLTCFVLIATMEILFTKR